MNSKTIKNIGTKIILVAAGSAALVGSAMTSYAQDADGLNTVYNSLNTFGSIVNLGTIIAVSLAFLFFFVNLALFIWSAGEEAKEQAKQKMFWGILAMIVISSLWGIIAVVRTTFGFDTGDGSTERIDLPTVKIPKN